MLNYDKLSRSNEEANSLSKEDVIEIEGIVREAMPNAIFKVEMLSEALKHITGFCYTQITDVEQEQNGIYNYDRTPKFDTNR